MVSAGVCCSCGILSYLCERILAGAAGLGGGISWSVVSCSYCYLRPFPRRDLVWILLELEEEEGIKCEWRCAARRGWQVYVPILLGPSAVMFSQPECELRGRRILC
jgi:hypothetical protein